MIDKKRLFFRHCLQCQDHTFSRELTEVEFSEYVLSKKYSVYDEPESVERLILDTFVCNKCENSKEYKENLIAAEERQFENFSLD